jgi:hypothetical protein
MFIFNAMQRYAKFELHATLCPKCGNGHEGFKLINEINEAVKDVKDKVGMLWLNVDCIGKHQGERVEHCGWNKPDYWGAKVNLAYLVKTIAYAKVVGFKVGIFTEMRDWDYITDNSKFLGQTLGMPLWYRGSDTFKRYADHWKMSNAIVNLQVLMVDLISTTTSTTSEDGKISKSTAGSCASNTELMPVCVDCKTYT